MKELDCLPHNESESFSISRKCAIVVHANSSMRAFNVISISSIQFDNNGWEKVDVSEEHIAWQNTQKPETMAMHYFKKAPDIPCNLDQLDQLRNTYRLPLAEAGGGIVSLEVIELQNLRCIDAIFKIPQQPHGMSYMGALTFPFADFSLVLKVQCPELGGLTGMREAIVVNEYLAAGQLKMDPKTNQLIGFAEDPYDPSFSGGSMLNKAEQEKYDSQFPDHPLSRTRKIMAGIKSSLKVSAELLSAKPFTGPK